MKYYIVIFSDSTVDLSSNVGQSLGYGIRNSGVFSNESMFQNQTEFVYYKMDSEQAQKANVSRDPTVGIGFVAPDGSVKIAYLYDENNISESRVAAAMKELNDNLISEGGGWVPGGGFQGGFPGGLTSLITLENVGDFIKSIGSVLIVVLIAIIISK